MGKSREDLRLGRRRLRDGGHDALVREEPLIVEVDGEQLVTMRTPGADEAFLVGFLLAEGIVEDAQTIETIDFRKGIPLDEPGPKPDGEGLVADRIVARLRAGVVTPRREALCRTHEIRPSCGICGVEELHDLLPRGQPFAPRTPVIATTTLRQLMREFEGQQSLFRATGGSHAAAIASVTGQLLGFGEDVGRHNAVDKAIGDAVRSGHDVAGSVGLLSGRAGYELIAKLLRVGCPIIVAISAASALSFDLCREAGATLIGFARDGSWKVYWDEERIDP